MFWLGCGCLRLSLGWVLSEFWLAVVVGSGMGSGGFLVEFWSGPGYALVDSKLCFGWAVVGSGCVLIVS